MSNEVRQSQGVDKDKCKCRIWKNGLDNIQCSRKKKDGTDFCGGKKHNEGWWLGFITEPRPEAPFGPPGVKTRPKTRHLWYDQVNTKPKRKSVVKNNVLPNNVPRISKTAKFFFIAVDIIPEPIGFVNIISSSILAVLFLIILSLSINPVTANPYFGTSSFIECPPNILMFAKLHLSIPPCNIDDKTLISILSVGKPTIFSANKGVPPIA
mgnify:CR=1 FL=1